MVNNVIVLGGGSAGFMAALALARKIPQINVTVIRSRDIGVIGVGEGSTVDLTKFLHEYLRVSEKKFFDIANPTWKLGLKFLWGPRSEFFYSFAPGLDGKLDFLPKNTGFYCDEEMSGAELFSAMMQAGRAFERGAGGAPHFHPYLSYHFENEKYVRFLEQAATALGVKIADDTVREVKTDETGVTALQLASGTEMRADLYVDCSGFASLLLGNSLAEPFESFKSSLFCDRAVIGGWDRASDESILPYTTCETMNSGWCWQIEHEKRINRGYVYCSSFISDEEAEREFRSKNPKVTSTRVVRFVSGRYRRFWVKNVVAIGNAGGFVEPLEATALGVIAIGSQRLTEMLLDGDRVVRESGIRQYNAYAAHSWEQIRRFIAVHYKFNTRLETPFWTECRERTDLAGAEPLVEYYRENGPSRFWEQGLLGPENQFGMAGYFAMLIGQKVPYQKVQTPTEAEMARWNAHRQKNRERAARAMTVREAIDAIRSPKWTWPSKT